MNKGSVYRHKIMHNLIDEVPVVTRNLIQVDFSVICLSIHHQGIDMY